MRGQEGIHDTTMLLRRSPFGEWVMVYYDPRKTTEAKILSRIRTNGCKNASIIRDKMGSVTMNPIIAAGDVAQLRIKLTKKSSLGIVKIPKDWKIKGTLKGLPAGDHFLNIRVPKRTPKKRYKIVLETDQGDSLDFHVEVVGRIPG